KLGGIAGVDVEMSREVGGFELDVSCDTVQGRNIPPVAGAGDDQHCIVALLDGGIDALHEAFLDDQGQSRILYVWDQAAAMGPSPESKGIGDFNYGRLHTRDDIAAAIKAGKQLPGLETKPLEEVRHGTHVASIAAGRAVPDDGSKSLFFGGIAPAARIVVVI